MTGELAPVLHAGIGLAALAWLASMRGWRRRRWHWIVLDALAGLACVAVLIGVLFR